jgi:hypothetical protein
VEPKRPTVMTLGSCLTSSRMLHLTMFHRLLFGFEIFIKRGFRGGS